MKAYIADTETTGHFEEQQQPEIIELAHAPLLDDFSLGEMFSDRYQPERNAISFGAMAVHHIIPADLAGCQPSSKARMPEDCSYLIGHNIDHDWKALGSPPLVKRICTLAMARRVWEDSPGHSLGACIYRILPFDVAREHVRYAHSAAADVRMTHLLLRHFLALPGNEGDQHSLEDLWHWSENCRIPRIWSFGKHRGKRIGHELGDGVPDREYHAWCAKQMEMDPYVRKALEMYKQGAL